MNDASNARPSAWDRIWAPHRREYIDKFAGRYSDGDCPFCLGDGNQELVVHRGELAYVLLNLYPYNAGHVLICPYRHVPLYDELTVVERHEIAELTGSAMRTLRKASGCEGFNIGMNQGAIAGAGVAGHLHQHVVPRWAADINFMPIIAGTKVMPEMLEDTRALLSELWCE